MTLLFSNNEDNRKRTLFLQSLPQLPIRQSNGHKGTYGLSVLIGGSYGMSGSISLAGQAALRAGSGLVRLLIPDSILDIVAGNMLEYMTFSLPSDRSGRIAYKAKDKINHALQTATAVAVGPGLNQSLGLEILVESLFHSLPQPLVLDADALNLLAKRKTFRSFSHQELQDFKSHFISKNGQQDLSSQNQVSPKQNILPDDLNIASNNLNSSPNDSNILLDHSNVSSVEHNRLLNCSELCSNNQSVLPNGSEILLSDHHLTNSQEYNDCQYQTSFNNTNDISKKKNCFDNRQLKSFLRILTPHPGEFARLAGIKISDDLTERLAAAHLFAQLNAPIILVLKGHETIISNGQKIFINSTGNPGMATGGSGDVLTGIITAFLAQGIEGFEAAQLGVALHGLAGDLAAESLSLESLVAHDLIHFLSDAIQLLHQTQNGKQQI